MSSRHYRRFIEKSQQSAESSEDEDVKPSNFNPTKSFAALSVDDTEKTDEEDNREVIESQVIKKENNGNGKKNKKKKKKEIKETIEEKNDREFDEALKEIVPLVSEENVFVQKNSFGEKMGYNTLCCDVKNFDADAEMIKLFGTNVIRAQKAERKVSKANKVVRSVKSKLVKSQSQWPTVTSIGISMQPVTSTTLTNDDNAISFTFNWDADYRIAQKEFKNRVASYDPSSISWMLQRHPYHVDCLLQMSEIYKQHGDYSSAAELIERAIYRLELSFHPHFQPWNTESRLDYNVEENQCLFLALHRHIQFLGRKGSCRTALEFSKLLLLLAPNTDPLCVLLSIDHYALRAKEYSWLLDFVGKFRQYYIDSTGEKSFFGVFLLPSFAYSSALAKYYLEVENSEISKNNFGDIALPNPSNSEWFLESLFSRSASEILQQALLLFPEMFQILIEKATDSNNQTKWQQLFHSDWYLGAKKRLDRSISLQKLINIYSDKNSILWKSAGVLDWLFKNATIVSKLVELPDSAVKLEAYSSCRLSLFDPEKPSKYSRIIVSEFSDIISTLPADELPLPGLAQADLGDLNLDAMPEHVQRQFEELQRLQYEQILLANDTERVRRDELANSNPFWMFLRTMLPWVNVGAQFDQNNMPLPPIPRRDSDSEDEDFKNN